MSTVAATPTVRPAYGSVEYYAEALRRIPLHQDSAALGLIEAAINDRVGTDAEHLEHVRNVLAAVTLVHAGLGAAR